VSTLQADARAASATMLRAYGTSAGLALQVYEGRPATINPPTAFVDRISETIEYVGITLRQRTPRVEVVVLHGKFDSKDSAAQKDAFVDGFLDWVTANYHAAGANTLIAVTSTDDEPVYVADWLPPERQGPWYATRMTLEGFAED
jgi:hypothetical protein